MKKWNELTEKQKIALMLFIDDLGEVAEKIFNELFEAILPIIDILDKMQEVVLLEKLASLEHDQWSEWMNHFFTSWQSGKVNLSHEDGEVYYNIKIASSLIVEWERKMNIHYNELLDFEKEYDRKFARKVIEVFKEFGMHE